MKPTIQETAEEGAARERVEAAEQRAESGWSAAMVGAALAAARSEMGEVFVNWDDPAVENELMMARYYLDRARAIVGGVDPAVVEGVSVSDA